MKKSERDAKNTYTDENDKNDVKNRARRRLIQTLAVGGGIASSKLVPTKWAAPSVESVVLPAHASGSNCTLGNTEAAAFITQIQPAGPVVGTGSLAQQLVDAAVPQANAGTPDDSEFEFTGCFWIEFLCNSNMGTLHASATPENISVKFTDGICDNIEYLWFEVNLGEGGNSATLRIGPQCNKYEELSLVPNFNCVPYVFDDEIEVPKGP